MGRLLNLHEIIALFAAFVDVANISASDLAVIIGVTLVAVGGVKVGYAYFAARVVSLVGGGGAYRPVKVTAGGLLVCAGAYLMVKALSLSGFGL